MLALHFQDPLEDDIRGRDATELLDNWNRMPHWASYSPLDFRNRILDIWSDSDMDEAWASDEEILAAVLPGMAPDTTLIHIGPADIQQEAKDASAGAEPV